MNSRIHNNKIYSVQVHCLISWWNYACSWCRESLPNTLNSITGITCSRHFRFAATSPDKLVYRSLFPSSCDSLAHAIDPWKSFGTTVTRLLVRNNRFEMVNWSEKDSIKNSNLSNTYTCCLKKWIHRHLVGQDSIHFVLICMARVK